jgi:hypothetical protein
MKQHETRAGLRPASACVPIIEATWSRVLDEIRDSRKSGRAAVADVFAEAVVVAEVAMPPRSLFDEPEDPGHVVRWVESRDAGRG